MRVTGDSAGFLSRTTRERRPVFEWEVGWNPLVVDESTWEPTTHQGISIWGHAPVGQTIVDKLTQFRRGALSPAAREDTVPALSGPGIPDD